MEYIDHEKNAAEFKELLRSTGRDGIEDVIADLDEAGFFIAPASAGHHLNVPGGLVQHSLNTCKAGLAVWESLKPIDAGAAAVEKDSVIIASLLHDVCKQDIYKPVTKRKKNAFGVWEDVPGYDVDYKAFPMGHGEKSVMLLILSGLSLTDAEMCAIRWHMGAWGINMNSYEDQRCYDTAKNLYPLVTIIQCADGIAAGIMEAEVE